MKTIVFTLSIISLFFQLTVKAQNFNKDDIKALKKSVPKGISIKPDYIEQVVWVSTPAIGWNGKKDDYLNPSTFTHKLYFMLKREDDRWVAAGLRYKLKYRGENWLFIEEMIIITANSNKETRKGEGKRYVLDLSNEESNTRVLDGGIVNESFDLYMNEVVFSWLDDVYERDQFTRLRVNGKTEYKDSVVKNSDFQYFVKSIIDTWKKYYPTTE